MRPSAALRPIRVLALDHTAGITAFRKKFAAIAARPEIELTVLAPERWVENYRVVDTRPDGASGYAFRTAPVGWAGYENRAFFRAGVGPALRDARPDVLHLWEEPFSVMALQALLLASIWAPRARAIFFSSDNLSGRFRYSYRPSAFYAAVERYTHKRCAVGTAVSEEVAAVLREKGFSKSIEVVPHGLDLSDYPADSDRAAGEIGRRASGEGVRVRLGLMPPIVGFVGRLLHQKGIDLLLRAVASLPRPRPSLILLGEGPDRGAFKSMVEELGLGDSTRFLAPAGHGEVPAHLSMIDVLVLPSRSTPRWKEQFGRVLIEGMAAGCAVIGSSSGAIPEVLGDAGVVFQEESSDDLARAIQRVLGDPAFAQSLRVRGRQRVRERYTWDAVADRVVAMYRTLLA
jgi:glycosyltransferase involved in cell wall biosynthesis